MRQKKEGGRKKGTKGKKKRENQSAKFGLLFLFLFQYLVVVSFLFFVYHPIRALEPLGQEFERLITRKLKAKV